MGTLNDAFDSLGGGFRRCHRLEVTQPHTQAAHEPELEVAQPFAPYRAAKSRDCWRRDAHPRCQVLDGLLDKELRVCEDRRRNDLVGPRQDLFQAQDMVEDVFRR
jgi:hypothetical protein